ncbi:MAG: S46 family peptidase [Rhizomicrobium sp.]
MIRHTLAVGPFVLGAATLLMLSGPAFADEGMWTFDNFPAQAVKAKYGVTIDQKWLDRIRGASARLSTGCSASVVSKDGLVLTNHHCVRSCAQNLSTGKTDYIKDGFFAGDRKNEKMCPGMQAEILNKIDDVTARVNKASAGKKGQEYVKARDAAIAAAEQSGCAGREDKFRCQVITLYQGGEYKLYTYRKYSDVRLVAAPEMQTAFFGGDPDNFNFPRYDLDFSFVRLYENGKPVATPDHLTWRVAAPKAGEPVFIAGNPGSTERLLTAADLEYLRDYSLPGTLIQYSELRGRLIRFGEESAENARIADSLLFGIENSFKALSGHEAALVTPGMVEAKAKADAELRSKVMADPKLAHEIGDPWADIVALAPERKAIRLPYGFLEARAGMASSLFSYARTLVRAAEERGKPNADRLPEYGDSRLPLVQKNILDAKPVYPELEKLALEFWLTKLRENLTADAEGTKVFLGKESPEGLAAKLATSKLADPTYRKALWDGGLKAIKASDDPMIRFVLATDATSRAVRKEFEEKIDGPLDRANERIAKARFAVYGNSLYPDATFSLRLSYGKVAGWKENGKDVAPFTYFSGLWQRATDASPFDLAPRWQKAKGKLNDATVFDFATTNDIIGGNSGSPAISAEGEVIGAVFDGNIHSLGGAFFFDERDNRAVVASTAAITEALEKVYGQPELVKELLAK